MSTLGLLVPPGGWCFAAAVPPWDTGIAGASIASPPQGEWGRGQSQGCLWIVQVCWIHGCCCYRCWVSRVTLVPPWLEGQGSRPWYPCYQVPCSNGVAVAVAGRPVLCALPLLLLLGSLGLQALPPQPGVWGHRCHLCSSSGSASSMCSVHH